MNAATRLLDAGLEWAKQWQRRLFASDYEDLQKKALWMEAASGTYFQEQVFPVLGPKDSVRTMLIFKPDEIGDAAVALPALFELRKAFPHTRLYLLCQGKSAAVYQRCGLFDEIVTFRSKLRLRRFPTFAWKEAIAKFSTRDFDLALYLRTYPAYFNYFKKLPGRIKVHPRDPRLQSDSVVQPLVRLCGEEREHQTLQLLSIVSALTGRRYTIDDVEFPPASWLESDRKGVEKHFANGMPARYFVLHPFANYETKRYPEPYWTKLVEQLRARFGLPIVVIGGPGDAQMPLGEGVTQLQGKLSLAETGFLLSKAIAFVGNESGPGHWAAALGIPVVSLMGGHSVPSEWAPFGGSLVLRTDVACAPCHLRSCSRYGLKCLTELTPARVWPPMEAFLARKVEVGKVRPQEPPRVVHSPV